MAASSRCAAPRISAMLVLAASASGAVVRAPPRPASVRWAGRRAQSLMAEQPAPLDLGFLSGPGLSGGAQNKELAFAVGDRVRVVATGLEFYHVPKHPNLDPKGLQGSVLRVIDYDQVSANLPVVVEFQEPRKFRAHFETHELERL